MRKRPSGMEIQMKLLEEEMKRKKPSLKGERHGRIRGRKKIQTSRNGGGILRYNLLRTGMGRRSVMKEGEFFTMGFRSAEVGKSSA